MKLLLDVHIPVAVVTALRRKEARLDVEHAANWRHGGLREAEDVDILAKCAEDRRIFVTYDLATVPALLQAWAEEGRNHAGVFLADDRTVPPERVGAVAEAIAAVVKEIWGQDTTNLIRYLQRGPAGRA